MPTFTRSAMNPNGSYQADGMDQSDQANFNLANQRNQQSVMAQIAMAQLRSGDARFAAERSDNMGMAGINALSSMNGQNLNHQDRLAELQASANRDKAEIGYKTGRDAASNQRYQQEWDAGTAARNAQNGMFTAQGDLAKAQLGAQVDEANRRKIAMGLLANPGTASTSPLGGALQPEVEDQYRRDLTAMTPADAGTERAKGYSASRDVASSHPDFLAKVSKLRNLVGIATNNGSGGDWWKTRVSGLDGQDLGGIDQSIDEAASFLTQRGWKPDAARQKVLDSLNGQDGKFTAPVGSGVFGTNEAVISLKKHLGIPVGN